MKPFELVQFQNLIAPLFNQSGGYALIAQDGACLWHKSDWFIDGATLPIAVQNVRSFFQLSDGDIIILNDPYAGGSWLSDLTFISQITVDSQPLYLARRIRLQPRIGDKKIDDEGVRIPPTPLILQGQLNLEILKAIRLHPYAPENLEELTLAEVDNIKKTMQVIKTMFETARITPNKKWLKDYAAIAKDCFLRKWREVSLGEATVEWPLADKNKIRLRLEIKDEHILFDFNGTSTASALAMTDALALSCCVGTVAAVFGIVNPWITGVIENFHLEAPRGSIVNTKFPSSVFLGVLDGSNLLSNLTLKALSLIDKQLIRGSAGLSNCSIELIFKDGRRFFDFSNSGEGASALKAGRDGFSLGRQFQSLKNLEASEKQFPLIWKTLSYRQSSGGSGKNTGGNGITKQIEVLEPCELRWFWLEQSLKPEGADGGKASFAAELQILRANGGEREDLSNHGTIKLAAHDQVILHSAGGGGFGALEP